MISNEQWRMLHGWVSRGFTPLTVKDLLKDVSLFYILYSKQNIQFKDLSLVGKRAGKKVEEKAAENQS